MYSDSGGSGPPVVFLHGVLMNGTLWKNVVDRLSDRYRCIVPELQLGAHCRPMPADADLSSSRLPDWSRDSSRNSTCATSPSSATIGAGPSSS